MNALSAMLHARGAGIDVTRDGDALVLKASTRPSAEVIGLLKQNKAGILKLLELKDGWSDEDWLSLLVSARPIEPPDQQQGLSKVINTPTVWDPPHAEPVQQSNHCRSLPEKQLGTPPSCNQIGPVFETEEGGGGKAGEGGDFSTSESDPNPNLPWPQPGDTLLLGWGARVSMEYRLRVASEEECLEWAKELWQLDLVAKARGYPKKWASQVAKNRSIWKEAFASR
jgi:hypothetical protein